MKNPTIDQRYVADAALVARIQNRDPKAEAEFYTKYVSIIRHWARKFLGNEEAEDIAHDVFTKALIHLRKGKHEICALLKSWLYKVTRNECINHLRRKQKVYENMGKEVSIGASSEASSYTLPLDVRDYSPDPLEIVHSKEHGEIIRKKIFSLPQTFRQSFIDFHLNELSFREMSLADGHNPQQSSHRVRCFFARKILRKDPELRRLYYGKA